MQYQKIHCDLTGPRASIRLPEPVDGYSIDEDIAAELRDCCSWLSLEDEIRVAVITGNGGVFAVGRKAGPHDATGATALSRLHWMEGMAVASAFAGLPMPTIAVLNGDATGHGLELAMAADLRIAVESSNLGVGSLRDCPFPYDGATQRLPRLVGPGLARDMLFTGRTLSAQEARDAGLVNRVVPEEDLLTATCALVDSIVTAAPIASRYAKEAVAASSDLTMAQGLRLEADLSVILHSTADRAEGLRSFADQRSPRFEGR